MKTNPVRVPETVHSEIQAAARVLGCNASELLERAWLTFRHSQEFVEDFEQAKKAFSVGDFDRIAFQLHDQATLRAKRRADAVGALRRDG